MRTTPNISLSAATGLIDTILARGGDPDQVLRSLGLRRRDVGDPHGFIACATFAGLLEAAAEATGDACFGLHFGERYNPKNVGLVTYLALNSPTFRDGFENIARYLLVHNEGARTSFAVSGPWAYFRHELTDPSIAPPRQLTEYSLAVARNVLRLMAGSQWAPAEVWFAHPSPRDTAEHARVFAAPVAFGAATNAFVIEREFADRPVPTADERLYPILKRYLDRALVEAPREDGLLAAVRRAVGESLRDGKPDLLRVARKLAMSRRTLQRCLREEGRDFKGLVDDTRHRFSLSYLRDRKHTLAEVGKHTLAEVARLLGYSEVSAFNRAFRRWTGATPSEYRHRR